MEDSESSLSIFPAVLSLPKASSPEDPFEADPFAKVPPEDWNSWHWQLAHRLRSVADLKGVIRLTPEEERGFALARDRFRVEVTPFFARLMDPLDPRCPIRRQVIPLPQEALVTPEERVDPCGEDKDSPAPGLVHRYPDRVLLLVTVHCATYCRYCTRSRVVGHMEENVSLPELEPAFRYIERHKKIRDVLLSGGDPLTLGTPRLEAILKRLRSIRHVEFLRIGTRVPIFLPQRIQPELLEMLRRYHPLWMSLHFNHAKEISLECARACEALADAGIPLGAQTVLLRGINDRPSVMKKLCHELLKIRVRPYYLYQCDPVVGTSHLRTSVETGLRIIESLRGHTTGYAVPTYVIDAPGGGGKIPLHPNYVVSRTRGRIVLRNYEGKLFEYVEPSASRRSNGTSPEPGAENGAGGNGKGP